MINYCTSLEIEIDVDLPKGVCVPCFKTIRIAYNFIRQFKELNKELLEKAQSGTDVQDKAEPSVANDTEEFVIEKNLEHNSFTYNYQSNTVEDTLHDKNNSMSNSSHEQSSSHEKCFQDIKTFENCDVGKSEILILSKVVTKSKPDDSEKDECDIEVKKSTVRTKKVLNRSLYSCPFCKLTFAYFQRGFVKHLHACHNEQQLKCKCSQDYFNSVDDYIIHFKKNHQFHCQLCNRIFKTAPNYYSHISIHQNGDDAFPCTHKNCTKKFGSAQRLRNHLKVHCANSKYVCSKCGSTFKTIDTFGYHLKTHDGKRNFLCTKCGKTFLQAGHLNNHMWSHTGVKRFPCDTCDKSYTSVTHLKKHKRQTNCVMLNKSSYL